MQVDASQMTVTISVLTNCSKKVCPEFAITLKLDFVNAAAQRDLSLIGNAIRRGGELKYPI